MLVMPEKPQKPGPDAERLKIDSPEGWEKAVDKALSKPKPKEGWPDPDDEVEPEPKAESAPDDDRD